MQWYGVVNSRIIAKLRKFQLGSPGNSEVELPNGSQLMVTKQARCLKRLQELNSLIAKFRRGLLRPRSDSTAESIFLQNFCSQLDPPLLSSSALYQAIRRDDSVALDQLLGVYASSDPKSGEQFPGLLPALLQCSVLCVSRKCVNSLLSQGGSLQDGDQSLHWLISKIGRRVKAKGRWSREEPAILDSIDKDSLHILTYIIDRVNPGHERVFNHVDSLGRIPLHHAVDYGLPNICQGILKHMFQRSASPSPGLIQDTEGLTPLHLAVFSGNTAVTNMLLEDMESKRALKLATDVDNTNVVPGSLLIIAIKSDHIRIFKLLAKSTINLNYRDSNGEAALYIAVRTGNQDYVKILLEASASHKELDLDIAENTYGRTPLIMACVMGNLQIMELLLQAGANSGPHDIFGWTAKDHASFRGYLVLAKTLMENISSTALSVNTEHQADLKTTGLYSTQPKQIGKKGAASSLQLPCTHGQSIPIGESQILVNLGALDSYKHVLAVDLSPYVSPATYTPQLAADFVVEIRALGGDETSSVIQLPIIEDMANKPWRFLTKDPSNFKLVFNIFPATAVGLEGNMVIGSAVALLGSLKQGLGLKRESLIRDFTIPILQKETLKYMGSLTFYFLVVTPFPNPLSTFKATLEMGKGTNPIIIGHRGTFSLVVAISIC